MGQLKKGSPVKELIIIAYAEDYDLAKQYRSMLGNHGILTEIKRQPKDAPGYPQVAIMVPEDMIDEAYSLITQQVSLYDNIFNMGYDFEGDDDVEDQDSLDEY